MTSSLKFKVRRSTAVAVQPARATPIEVKSLSDWDNQAILRNMVPAILFYKHSGATGKDEDPAETIKRALAEALVYYYPWAGRLKDGPDRKLVVDCTAEGVVFVEADADVRLDQFGEESFQPPFPCAEELFCNKAEAHDHPLFTMQVTRLLCGGFVLAFTFSHVISDGFGVAMFLTAISELAAGAPAPSILPVWQREELLNARDPPRAPCSPTLNIFDGHKGQEAGPSRKGDDVGTCRSFFFGAAEISAIRARIPESLRGSCTSFDLILGCVVHCRVTSLQHAPEEQVRVLFPVNCRKRFLHPFPAGYYGNVSFNATFVSPMEDLHDLGCAVERVKNAKESVTEDYARSLLDLEVIRRRTATNNFTHNCTAYLFSDWSKLGFATLDFGSWGKPIFAGTPYNGDFRHVVSYIVAFTNQKGEEGRLLNLYMPKQAMDRFSITLRTLLGSLN